MKRVLNPLVALLLGVAAGVGGTHLYEAGYLTGCTTRHAGTLGEGYVYAIGPGTTTTVKGGIATTCNNNRLW
jgi:hypothetical protein